MNNIDKILKEFDELLSHFKNSKELPNTAVNRLRRKTNTDLENEIKSFITAKIQQVVAEDMARVRGEIEKYMSYCVELQNKAIANGNTITVETWGNRWVGAKEILSSLDKPDKE